MIQTGTPWPLVGGTVRLSQIVLRTGPSIGVNDTSRRRPTTSEFDPRRSQALAYRFRRQALESLRPRQFTILRDIVAVDATQTPVPADYALHRRHREVMLMSCGSRAERGDPANILFAVLEFERDAPRPIHVDRVARGLKASQGMEIKAGDVHFLGHCSSIQAIQTTKDARMHFLVDFRRWSLLPKLRPTSSRLAGV
jgi:hypothetical protein